MSQAPMEPEVEAAVLELDEATEKVAAALEKCAEHVNAGKLDGNVVMLKIHELAARLMGGGVPA